jgi:hypothetical protein
MKKLITLLTACVAAGAITAQITITDASLVGGTTYNWTNNNTYLVDGLVFLEEGGVLNIQEGTVVKFTEQEAGSASALIVARGAKIYAIGTPDAPIIFTAEADDVSDPADLGPSDVQLWGGLILLGKATTEKSGMFEVSVEGISSNETRGLYGAPGNNPANFDDNDNSGELSYISIRHTGFGLTTGSELQGLTLGGVGRGTKLSFVDIYASSDDGMEIFGGTVDLKYFSVAFAEDDSYDFDEGWKGNAQFLFSIQRSDVADSGWEYDGSTPDDAPNHTQSTIYNFTHIGSGPGAAASNPIGLLIRAGGSVNARNGIVAEMKGKAIEIQDKDANGTTDAYARFLAGETTIQNNLFYNIGSNIALDGSSTGIIRVTANANDSTPSNYDAAAAAFVAHFGLTNEIGNPGFVSISRNQDGGLDPRPALDGPAYTSALASYPSGDFYTPVSYKGAISSSANQCYLAKWTTLAKNGHLAEGLEWNGLGVGINEYNNVLSDLKVFPNPANGLVNISYNAANPVNVEIYNLQGQIVRSVNGLASGVRTESIPVSNLNAGLYIVRFTDGTNVFTQKLLID